MANARDIEARAAAWLSRRDRGDWTRTDQAELDHWLDESIAHRTAFLRLESVWERADHLAEGVTPPLHRRVVAFLFTRPAAIAACLTLCLVGAGWFVLTRPTVVHATEIGHRADIALADGSRLVLNTNTRLLTVVDRTTREVWLDRGEAYFQVVHDPDHPFVIHAGKQVITVLGTRFSVRLENGRFRLAVAEGRVRLDSNQAAARPMVLTPGKIVTATDGDVLVTSETPDQLESDLAWRQGWLEFDQVTLASAAAEFNRYSNRRLIITDPAVGAIRIGGRFATNNVEGFARLMQSGLRLRVEYRPDAILISG